MVVVTGMGAVTALGSDVAETWAAIVDGRTGIGPVRTFDVSAFDVDLAASVHGDGDEPFLAFARLATAEAWAQASPGDVDPGRIGVFVGTSAGGRGTEAIVAHDPSVEAARARQRSHHRVLAGILAADLGATGPRITVSTACASSNVAIGLAMLAIADGSLDVALVGGADGLSERRYAGFYALGVLAPSPCAPFCEPFGTTLGEGAGFLVLERADRARARGAVVLGAILGYGSSSDGWHATASDPTGGGVMRAMQAALDDAGLSAADVDAISAHGTGTASNDASEARALATLFGDVPVTATKAAFGHTFGASGALQAIVALRSLATGIVPPTANVVVRRPEAPVGLLTAPLHRDVAVVLSNNAAFGGANATVIVGRPRARSASQRLVFVDGAGEASEDVDVERELRGVDAREADPLAAMLGVACARALGGPVRGPARDRTGLFVGVSRRPYTAGARFADSIDARGLGRASASAFSQTVMNASGGAASRWLGLRGPTATFASPGAGLLAIASAVRWLAGRSDADRIVAGGVDERILAEQGFDPERPGAPRGDVAPGAGAAAVSLATSPSSIAVRAGIVGPDRLIDAMQALSGDGVDAVWSTAGGPRGEGVLREATRGALGDVAFITSPAFTDGYAEACTSASACVRARASVAGGGACLVVCAHEDVSVVVRLECR